MRLYHAPAACSLAPHIVAREAGLDLALTRVDLASHKAGDGRDFHEVNPSGYVPALELPDREVLTEAGMRHGTADRRADPNDGSEASRLTLWSSAASAGVHDGRRRLD